MKRTICRFAAVFVLLSLCIVLLFPAACAGSAGGDDYIEIYGGDPGLLEELRLLPDYKFQFHKEGLGYGTCPVYTAPYENALRAADGKAACDTNAKTGEAGYDNGWLLVRYETNSGASRVGYIPPNYLHNHKSSKSLPKLGYIPVTAAGQIQVTDDPVKGESFFGTIQEGEIFHILSKYTYNGNWWYVECTINGQPARGFIDRAQSSFYIGDGSSASLGTAVSLANLGSPVLSPLGTEKCGTVTIEYGRNGSRKLVHSQPNANSTQVSVAYPGNTYPCYDVHEASKATEWYYIWIDDDSTWGWVSSGVSTLTK